VRLIHARLRGESLPARIDFKPILITRDNVDSAALREMLYARWRPGAADLKRSVTE